MTDAVARALLILDAARLPYGVDAALRVVNEWADKRLTSTAKVEWFAVLRKAYVTVRTAGDVTDAYDRLMLALLVLVFGDPDDCAQLLLTVVGNVGGYIAMTTDTFQMLAGAA